MAQRGRNDRSGQKLPAWNTGRKPPSTGQQHQHSSHHAEDKRAEAERRFQAAKAKLEQSVQKHINYDASSSEEEDELQSDSILGTVLQSYSKSGGGFGDLGRTQQFLEDAFQSGAATCLICIASVKRPDPIWSCEECYCFFHLTCIQRWAGDSIAQQKRSIDDLAPYEKPPELLWGCPKCRRDYHPSETPQRYVCFCGRTEDPTFQPWLVPHSCGETCHKPLLPECGHKCLLLCHPGPCPPCPQVVRCSCFCSKSTAQPRRCSDQKWSCSTACNRLLGCGKHKCQEICHEGPCKPCPRTSKQKCECQAQAREQPCATPKWQCEKVCGRQLLCGHHSCKEICHTAESCGLCPFSGLRTCPCGKATYPSLACTSEAPTCGDTCGKMLACGAHLCQQRCHRENCGACFQVSNKSCRCGLYTREMSCLKEFLCEVKCKRSRSCLRHPCNRKCCDSECPPCEKVCGKMLGCGKHKCTAICHRGPCYPCPLTETLSCSCGETKIVVPCGRKKHVRPPKCNKPCRIPPDCHHPTRERHKCHPGPCPSCKQKCGQKYLNCSHFCPAPCHSAVWVTIVINADKPLAGPWEKRESFKEMKALPCPNCMVPVPVTCLGGHETAGWPCHQATPTSCARSCGRNLPCGNHQCMLPCHTVIDAKSELVAGSNCDTCESACSLPRPPGCTHSCFAPCHPGQCKPCQQAVKLKCHCGLNQLHPPCHKWTKVQNSSQKDQEEILCCGNQCPKNYACGHRCKVNCHSGECPDPESCQKKVKVPCPCKRLRKEFSCEAVRSNKAKVACDDVCKKKQKEEKMVLEKEEEQRKQEQKRKEREELEKFEKWQHGKKKHRERRRQNTESEEPTFWQKYGKYIVLTLAGALVSGFAYNLVTNS